MGLSELQARLDAQVPTEVPAPKAKPRPQAKRSYFDGAAVNRLTGDWTINTLSADREIRADLRKMRGRSRELFRNNDYAVCFQGKVVSNVLGPDGIKLQARNKSARGKADDRTNKIIEDGWTAFGRKGVCTVDGQQTLLDFIGLVLKTACADGEALIRLYRGRGPHGLQLQLLDADQLIQDSALQASGNGNIMRMGVEQDAFGRPVAYHFSRNHPDLGIREIDRIPAEEIIHLFIRKRPGQSRGLPWLHSAMKTLNMLDGYMEAELVAARAGAAKMGFFTTELGEAYDGDGPADATTGVGTMEAEAGVFESLPPGVDFKSFDPQHPTAAFPFFQKAVLRSVASGALVSYNGLASDLEGVNFSSIRSGVLEEREQWRTLQRWLIDYLMQPLYEAWVEMAILAGALELPRLRPTKALPEVRWVPRGWSWVDPLKDIEASVLAIEKGLDTRANVLASSGDDVEEIFEQLKEEKELADKFGLVFVSDKPANTLQASQQEDVDGETPPKPGAKPKKEAANG